MPEEHEHRKIENLAPSWTIWSTPKTIGGKLGHGSYRTLELEDPGSSGTHKAVSRSWLLFPEHDEPLGRRVMNI